MNRGFNEGVGSSEWGVGEEKEGKVKAIRNTALHPQNLENLMRSLVPK
jgi:hypothetical protein